MTAPTTQSIFNTRTPLLSGPTITQQPMEAFSRNQAKATYASAIATGAFSFIGIIVKHAVGFNTLGGLAATAGLFGCAATNAVISITCLLTNSCHSNQEEAEQFSSENSINR